LKEAVGIKADSTTVEYDLFTMITIPTTEAALGKVCKPAAGVAHCQNI
jgi:hypothetical protein